MTLDELIQRLEDIREEVGGEVSVRGVQQPDWPLLGQIQAITTVQTGDLSEVFIGLAEPKDYGSQLHYEDDFVESEYDEEVDQ
jgi:hypothetical protein